MAAAIIDLVAFSSGRTLVLRRPFVGACLFPARGQFAGPTLYPVGDACLDCRCRPVAAGHTWPDYRQPVLPLSGPSAPLAGLAVCKPCGGRGATQSVRSGQTGESTGSPLQVFQTGAVCGANSALSLTSQPPYCRSANLMSKWLTVLVFLG